MKFTKIIFTAIAILWTSIAISCTKFEDDTLCVVPEAQEKEIGASFEDSKTSLSGVHNFWSEGDKIDLFSADGNKSTFVIQSGYGTVNAVFKGIAPEGKAPFYAVYPASQSYNTFSDGKLKFHIFQEQTYVEDSYPQDANIAVASYASLEDNACFKNVLGMLCIGLKGNQTISKMILRDKAGKSLWGDATITMDGKEGTDEQTISYSGGDKAVVLNFSKEVSLNGTAKYFYFILPTGTLTEGFDLELTTETGLTTISSSVAHTIKRGQITCMEDKDITPTTWPEKGMEDKTYITNGIVQMGVDLQRGGAIFHFSEAKTKRNLLNHVDAGREVQQSYYGNSDGSDWNGTSWRYNPVQGGGWKNGYFGEVTSSTVNGNYLKVVSTPRHWASCVLLPECVMTEEITLEGSMAHIKFNFKYSGTKSHSSNHQELPAVFCDGALPYLVYYNGSSPWTGGSLTKKEIAYATSTAGINKYLQGNQWSEKWAAWVDSSNWGIGAYSPSSTLCTYYRYGTGASSGPKGGDCSYFAPLKSFAITPGMDFTYHVYLYIGTTTEIRAAFKKAAGK